MGAPFWLVLLLLWWWFIEWCGYWCGVIQLRVCLISEWCVVQAMKGVIDIIILVSVQSGRAKTCVDELPGRELETDKKL